MTVVFRSDADVTNGSAGTSVVVSRPTGTADGDLLVAYIAATGTPTITPPAGWTLIATQDASTSVRLAAYRKVASGEPASWTWTLGSSQRNWGWVGAYTGVDLADPVIDFSGVADTTAGTSFSSAPADITLGAVGTGAVAAVRTASGAATTWTGGTNERADLSTNAGSGTDIAGAVVDTTYVGIEPAQYGPIWTASQSQTAGSMLLVTLRPAGVWPGSELVDAIVEAAFGADPDGDPDDYDWTDISDRVTSAGVTITVGLQPDSNSPMGTPTNVTFALLNPGGDFTPDNPVSQYWPHIQQDTPVRVSVPYGYAPPTERAFVFVESWLPTWDTSTNDAIVEVQAYGRLHRVQTVAAPVMSALRRALSGVLPGSTARAHAYWPCEDASGAGSAASAFVQLPAAASPGVSFASASDCPGSGPLPTLEAGATLLAPVAAYTPTGQWAALAVVKLPAVGTLVGTTQLLRVLTTGSSLYWWIEFTAGSPDTLHLRAYQNSETPLLDAAVSLVEADVYDNWILLYIGVTQDGANVDYRGGYATAEAGVSVSGTLNSHTIGRGVQVRMAADATTAGMAVGHLTLISDPAYDYSAASDIAFVALDGRSGDRTYRRFQDLCTEAGLPHNFYVDIDLPPLLMGPQTPTTLPAALEECAATDQGLIHDAGPGGEIIMVARNSRYNTPVALTIDVDERELSPPFGPQYTTRNRVSDSTVARAGGSSARYVDPTIRGARPEQQTYSLHNDLPLFTLAGYRVRLSTTPGMRYPSLAMNLRGAPGLARQWLSCRIGSRVQAVNLWAGHGPNAVDQFADGWVERISGDRWDVTLHCNPARPYDVPVLEADDATVFRADCAATTLAVSAGNADTALLVVSDHALVSTDPNDYPVDIDVGGEQITVTSEAAPAFVDSFSRTGSGWGTPDDSVPGTAYTVSGSASDYSTVGGTTGRIAAASVGTLYLAYADMGSPHGEVRARVVVPVLPTGGPITVRTVGRITSAADLIEAQITVNTSGSVSLQLFRRVSGSGSAVPGAVSTTVGSHSAGNAWVVCLYYVGDVIKARAWNDVTDTDPGRWQVIGSDTTVPLTGTSVGAAIRRETGNTNPGTVNVDWSDIEARNPQVLPVTRGQFARSHAAGTSVRLWRGRGVAL